MFLRVIILGAAAFGICVLSFSAALWWRDANVAANDPAFDLAPSQGPSPSARQREMLSDGIVTEAEVREALGFAADCLEAHGVQPTRLGDPQLEGNLVLGFFVPDGADRGVASKVVLACDLEHSASVTAAYRVQTRGSSPSNPVLPQDGKPFMPPVAQPAP